MTTQVVTIREPSSTITAPGVTIDVSTAEPVASIALVDELIIVNVTTESSTVTVETVAATIDTTENVVTVTESVSGPQGASGPTTEIVTTTAGETLSGHRAVRLVNDEAVYASAGESTHATSAIGVSHGAALSGDGVAVTTHGIIVEGSWTWTPALPVFVGVDGALTQAPPAAPLYQRVIGYAVSATSLHVDPQSTVHQI